ncbi:hypothetical protein P8F81_01970 [Kosakonia cowanii]|uniref:hypothetical protein n=1 Tax=Kosakonia cowanii TaxID=208223 RepID=UPI002DDD8A32|nr:hypothetical protein [Kosakonia cowanii]WRY59823.1 hypothetical protein P8F81_01970 [Kosakonia cowanii]
MRTVLLDGHGTRPADLIGVSVDQWRQVVNEQAAILAKEVDSLWLGGFYRRQPRAGICHGP